MKLPNNGGCHQIKIDCQEWVTSNNVGQRVLQTTQVIANTVGDSPKTDRKALLLNTISTRLTEYGEVELVCT